MFLQISCLHIFASCVCIFVLAALVEFCVGCFCSSCFGPGRARAGQMQKMQTRQRRPAKMSKTIKATNLETAASRNANKNASLETDANMQNNASLETDAKKTKNTQACQTTQQKTTKKCVSGNGHFCTVFAFREAPQSFACFACLHRFPGRGFHVYCVFLHFGRPPLPGLHFLHLAGCRPPWPKNAKQKHPTQNSTTAANTKNASARCKTMQCQNMQTNAKHATTSRAQEVGNYLAGPSAAAKDCSNCTPKMGDHVRSHGVGHAPRKSEGNSSSTRTYFVYAVGFRPPYMGSLFGGFPPNRRHVTVRCIHEP